MQFAGKLFYWGSDFDNMRSRPFNCFCFVLFLLLVLTVLRYDSKIENLFYFLPFLKFKWTP